MLGAMPDVLINGQPCPDAQVRVRWFKPENLADEVNHRTIALWAVETLTAVAPESSASTAPVAITIAGRAATGGWGKRTGTVYGVSAFPFEKEEWEKLVAATRRRRTAASAASASADSAKHAAT